jgi:hypothetical protein
MEIGGPGQAKAVPGDKFREATGGKPVSLCLKQRGF